MKVLINESKFVSSILTEMLNEYEISDGNAFHNPYRKRFKKCKEMLKKFIATYGKIMTSKENGKDYYVYEIYSLSQSLGVRYAICQVIDMETNKPQGTILIKPFEIFKVKNY